MASGGKDDKENKDTLKKELAAAKEAEARQAEREHQEDISSTGTRARVQGGEEAAPDATARPEREEQKVEEYPHLDEEIRRLGVGMIDDPARTHRPHQDRPASTDDSIFNQTIYYGDIGRQQQQIRDQQGRHTRFDDTPYLIPPYNQGPNPQQQFVGYGPTHHPPPQPELLQQFNHPPPRGGFGGNNVNHQNAANNNGARPNVAPEYIEYDRNPRNNRQQQNFDDINIEDLQRMADKYGVDTVESILLGQRVQGLRRGDLAKRLDRNTVAVGGAVRNHRYNSTPMPGGRHSYYGDPEQTPHHQAALTKAAIDSEMTSTYCRDISSNTPIFGIDNLLKIPGGLAGLLPSQNPVADIASMLQTVSDSSCSWEQAQMLMRQRYSDDRVRELRNPNNTSPAYNEGNTNPLAANQNIPPPFATVRGKHDMTPEALNQWRKRIGHNRYAGPGVVGKDKMTLEEFLHEVKNYSNVEGGYSQAGVYKMMLEASTGLFRTKVMRQMRHVPLPIFWNTIQKQDRKNVCPEAAGVKLQAINVHRPKHGIDARITEIDDLAYDYSLASDPSCMLKDELDQKIRHTVALVVRWWPHHKENVLGQYFRERDAWAIARNQARERGENPDLTLTTTYHAFETLRDICIDKLSNVDATHHAIGIDDYTKSMAGTSLIPNVSAVEYTPVKQVSTCYGKITEPREDEDFSREDFPEVSAFTPGYEKRTNIPAIKLHNLTDDEKKPYVKGTSKVEMFCTYCLDIFNPHYPRNCETWPEADTTKVYERCKDCKLRHPPLPCRNKTKWKLTIFNGTESGLPPYNSPKKTE